MSKMLQLDPPIPVITPLGEAIAHFAWTDDANTQTFGVFQLKTGESWWFDNRFIRLIPSITGERYGTSPIYMEPDMLEKMQPHLARHGITPSGHAVNCEWHCEQVPRECTCGFIKSLQPQT